MKVLLVHEYYRSTSPSGEDKAFEQEKRLLEHNGNEVECLIFRNDDIGAKKGPSVLKAALYTPWSPIGTRLVIRALENFTPDIVHFHNTFPVLSQSAIWQAKRTGTATVQTFHNFRSVCAQALLIRNNKVCEKCVGHYPWPAAIHGCYRSSLLATLPLALSITVHRFLDTWKNKVDRYIVLSEFNRKKFIQAGFPEYKISVKPNFFEDYYPKEHKKVRETGDWIFVGRLKEEKGVQYLPEVWKMLGDNAPVLHVLGEGPCRERLKNDIEHLQLRDKIILHGNCSAARVKEMLRNSSLLVFPSIWYEGFPLVIGEAYAASVPVAASKIGTPEYIVHDGGTGIHFTPGDIEDMARKLSYLSENPELLRKMGMSARKEYEQKYTPDRNYGMLMKIYQEAIEENNKA